MKMMFKGGVRGGFWPLSFDVHLKERSEKMEHETRSAQPNRRSFFILVMAFGFMIFSDGQWAWAVAPWVGLPLLLRFVRLHRPLTGYLAAVGVVTASSFIAWYGLYPASIPKPIQVLYYLLPSLVLALPYLADRLIAPRLAGVWATLVFPMAFTAIRFAMSFRPGHGTYGSLAYTQYGNLPLMQLASVTGIWGIAFLIAWFASTVNACWENDFDFRRVRKIAGVYGCVWLLVYAYGAARLFLIDAEKTVRVAAVMTPDHAMARMMGERGGGPFDFRESLAVLKSKTIKAARAGAKIVAWQEYADLISDDHIDAYIRQGQKLADRENIYLLLTAGVLDKHFKEKGENLSVLIDPEGQIRWKYLKRYLVPMVEEPYFKRGDRKIPSEETPYGKIAQVICFDNDHPRYVRSAADDVGLLVVPSFDGRILTPVHSKMAVFRAIENGFSILKPTGRGLSIAADACGRVIAKQNYFTTKKSVMLADVPIQAVHTIYEKIGGVFPWVSVLGLVGLAAVGLRSPGRPRHS
jgi:apolipoprotein N-acyltransferase